MVAMGLHEWGGAGGRWVPEQPRNGLGFPPGTVGLVTSNLWPHLGAAPFVIQEARMRFIIPALLMCRSDLKARVSERGADPIPSAHKVGQGSENTHGCWSFGLSCGSGTHDQTFKRAHSLLNEVLRESRCSDVDMRD